MSKERKQNGYENFFDVVWTLIKKHNINGVSGLSKHLKALDIIKNKPFNNMWFTYYKDYEDYCENAEYVDESKRLTKEEYELLKEVLL